MPALVKRQLHDDIIFRVTGPLWSCENSPLTIKAGGGGLIFSLICAWINDWVNNRDAGDLRFHRAHCDISVMLIVSFNRSVQVQPIATWVRQHHISVIWRCYQKTISSRLEVRFITHFCRTSIDRYWWFFKCPNILPHPSDDEIRDDIFKCILLNEKYVYVDLRFHWFLCLGGGGGTNRHVTSL